MSSLRPSVARTFRSIPLHRYALVLTPLALLAACGAKDAAPTAGAPSGPPPATVGVVTVASEAVALQTELPGRVSAVRVAQVRARVNGVVQKRLFREGSEVKAGDLLFKIEDDIMPLLEACNSVMNENALFVLYSCHTPGFTPLTMENQLREVLARRGGTFEAGEMVVRESSGRPLPSGTWARWVAPELSE